MAVLALGGWLLSRRLKLDAIALAGGCSSWSSRPSTARSATPCRPSRGPYRAFIGTLFVFILPPTGRSLVPGVEPPTAHLETDAALALLVFVAVIWFGIRAGGVGGYLQTFASPSR